MIVRADARRIPLPDRSVQCVVTSPPYFGLRDYGVAGQIGLEATPEAYVARLVDVFREVRRVLRDDGTLWLNLGDSYAQNEVRHRNGHGSTLRGGNISPDEGWNRANHQTGRKLAHGLKPKDLIGIPWRVAFALQADGWYLRSDIVWAKPNPMPESVTDRPTKAHEYLFLLAKSERYHYDADAIREPHAEVTLNDRRFGTGKQERERNVGGRTDGFTRLKDGGNGNALGRNRRSVWTINPVPFPGAHFATMPPKLVEPCVLAGAPPGGLVFDPFGGAGTVVVVAEALGRRGVATELSADYCRLARRRLDRPHAPPERPGRAEEPLPLFG